MASPLGPDHTPMTWPPGTATTASVVAYGYHGHDLLVVEPVERKQAIADDIATRSLQLKRMASNGLPLQQPLMQAVTTTT